MKNKLIIGLKIQLVFLQELEEKINCISLGRIETGN